MGNDRCGRIRVMAVRDQGWEHAHRMTQYIIGFASGTQEAVDKAVGSFSYPYCWIERPGAPATRTRDGRVNFAEVLISR